MKDELLHRISRYLMLHGSFCNNIGLLNGKTGIVIFFFHYARYTGKKVYADFAGELIDEIYKEIHVNSPLNFKDGLCGIAWGMEYLIRNHFVEGNPDVVLEDLDKRIIEWDVRRITDYSLETGLSGIASYVISRMANREKEHISIRPDYIYDLIVSLKKNIKDNTNREMIEIMEDIIKGNTHVKFYNPVFNIIEKIKYNTQKIFEPSRSVGIVKAGYAGIGLQLMEINKQ